MSSISTHTHTSEAKTARLFFIRAIVLDETDGVRQRERETVPEVQI